MPFLLVGWMDVVGFPETRDWARDIPQLPFTFIFGLPSLPAALAMFFLNTSQALGDAVPYSLRIALFPTLAVLINASVYALIGAHVCMITRSLRAAEARRKNEPSAS